MDKLLSKISSFYRTDDLYYIGLLATSKIGTHWDPRDQGVGIASVSFLSVWL